MRPLCGNCVERPGLRFKSSCIPLCTRCWRAIRDGAPRDEVDDLIHEVVLDSARDLLEEAVVLAHPTISVHRWLTLAEKPS